MIAIFVAIAVLWFSVEVVLPLLIATAALLYLWSTRGQSK